MIYLILLIFGVFVIFWLGDLVITIKTTNKLGHNVEVNPIIRTILKFRSKFIYVFKLIEVVVFLYLIWYITKFNGVLSYKILLVFILIYSVFVLNNAYIYGKVIKKQSIVFSLVYVALVLAILLFIHLNYLLYQDLGVTYNAIKKSNDDYNKLYAECKQQNISAESPKELEDLLNNLNLSIRR
jgi:hypothetical protein